MAGMNKGCLVFLLFINLVISACQGASATPPPEVYKVQYTNAALPWLADLGECAPSAVFQTEQRTPRFFDLGEVDFAIRIGEPEELTTPAYQIDSEEIVVIVNKGNPIGDMDMEQVRRIFSGAERTWQTGNSSDPIHVWVYAPGEDVEQVFEQVILHGAPVTPEARLAVNIDAMLEAISADDFAVGMLPLHAMTVEVKQAFLIGSFPVLVLSSDEPGSQVLAIIACLQGMEK
jgi:DNA-binding transcriptional LysR family regulator